MRKKDWIIIMIILNLFVIGLVVWLTWVQPKKSVPLVISEVKVERLKVERTEDSRDFSKKVATKTKEPVQKVEKKPEKKVVEIAKKTEKKESVSSKPTKVNTYGILSDTYINPSLKFDTANPGNVDGGYLGAWGTARVSGGIPNTYTDPPTSLMVDCSGGWGGIWLQFGYDPGAPPGEAVRKDMSSYGEYMKFDIKSNGEVIIGLEWWDTIVNNKDSAEKKLKQDLNIPADDIWHSVKIDLSKLSGKNFKNPINFKTIKLPASFCGENVTFYIDNLRWEK